MPYPRLKQKQVAVARAALPFAISLALASRSAAGRQGKPRGGAEVKYQTGGSPMAGEEMHQSINPKAPPMTRRTSRKASRFTFSGCAGCHGVLRKGATGKPLTTDKTLVNGTEYLKTFIKCGSPAGMPNWGTSGELTRIYFFYFRQ